jgi:hypothetical protein
MLAHGIGYPGKPIPGQVDQPLLVGELEKIDQLRPSRGLAGPGELPPINNNIDGTRLNGVGSTGNGDLASRIGRELIQGIGTLDKCGIRVLRHGLRPDNVVYNLAPQSERFGLTQQGSRLFAVRHPRRLRGQSN